MVSNVMQRYTSDFTHCLYLLLLGLELVCDCTSWNVRVRSLLVILILRELFCSTCFLPTQFGRSNTSAGLWAECLGVRFLYRKVHIFLATGSESYFARQSLESQMKGWKCCFKLKAGTYLYNKYIRPDDRKCPIYCFLNLLQMTISNLDLSKFL